MVESMKARRGPSRRLAYLFLTEIPSGFTPRIDRMDSAAPKVIGPHLAKMTNRRRS